MQQLPAASRGFTIPMDRNDDATAALLCLSRLIDQCLELDADAMEQWLSGLPAHHRCLTPQLRAMAASHRAGDAAGFLATCPRLPEDDEASTAVAGADVGPYTLLQQIGRGGMGTVWRAAHRVSGRHVAVKLRRRPHASGAAAQLANEAEITALMQHPRVARLLDSGVDATHGAFLALDLVEGTPLVIGKNPKLADLQSRLRLFAQMAQAVAHVHASGVVHRDIKPSNFIVTPQGEVHLIDFGIAARVRDACARAVSTGAGAFTPAYAPPEQVRGERATPASDVYALGLVLCELLTGSRSPGALPLRGLGGIVRRALAPFPSARYASADRLLRAVQAQSTSCRASRSQGGRDGSAARQLCPI